MSKKKVKEPKMTAIQIYKEKNEYMSQYHKELTPSEFYKEIFPPETLEKKGDISVRASNPIFTFRKKSEDGKRAYFQNEIVFGDTFDESLAKTSKNDLALCSMISYSGRRKSAKNAYKCHGFCIDLDGVGMKELQSFWGWVDHLERIPCPTYVANSGHGLHIYYLFQNPVPLYPQVVEYLQRLKRGLTMWVWNKETSNYLPKERQFQGIYQSFRMPGSRTKLGSGTARNKYLVRVWRTGKPWSLEELNEFVEPEYRCPADPDYSSWEWADADHHSLEECRRLYPDWYQERIIEGREAGQWKCNRGLYDWWLDKIQEPESAHDGNRFHCISMLYVYGVKCALAKELIDEDAYSLLEPFNALTTREDNKFTAYDIECAEGFYDSRFAKLTRAEIERRTGIQIPPARRNGRKREDHLKRARFSRDLEHPDGTWREGNGRPDKKNEVIEWRKYHPNGTKYACIKETGLSKMTVYKWWNSV